MASTFQKNTYKLAFLILASTACPLSIYSQSPAVKKLEVIVKQRLMNKTENPPARVFGINNPIRSSDNFQTEQINLKISERYIYLPAIAYADLYNLNRRSLKLYEREGDYFISLHGSDGENGYNVIFRMGVKGDLKERSLETLFGTQFATFKEVPKQ